MARQVFGWPDWVEPQPFFSEQAMGQVFFVDCSLWRPVRWPEQGTPLVLEQDQDPWQMIPQTMTGFP